jgi:adenosylhomocysteine nucleosidase
VNRPLALMVAMAQERRTLQRRLDSVRQQRLDGFPLVVGHLAGQAVVLVQSGIGRDRARRALLAVSHLWPLRAVWSLGFAGGLVDGIIPGDLVCPAAVLSDDGGVDQPLVTSRALADLCAALAAGGIRAHNGLLLTVDDPLRTPQMKRAAHQRTGAVAVDMEAAGVARASLELGVPWLAIKAVVDAVEEPLPEFLARCTTPHGDLRWGGVFRSLWASENRRALGRLARASRRAALSLGDSLGVALAAWSP